MSEELNRIAVALEAIADFQLLGLVLQHGIEAVNEAMQEINYEESQTE